MDFAVTCAEIRSWGWGRVEVGAGNDIFLYEEILKKDLPQF